MNRFRFWDGISAKIADIERMLAGRGKVFSETEVNRAQAAYRGIVPDWYAKLWKEAAIFEADLHIFDKAKDEDPIEQVRTLVLDGPDDGWKVEDQKTIIKAGYFTLGNLDTQAYWVLGRSKSKTYRARVAYIDHEYMDDPEEISKFDSIRTFANLINSVVDWPILHAIDLWRETARKQEEARLKMGKNSPTSAETPIEDPSEPSEQDPSENLEFHVVQYALEGFRSSSDEFAFCENLKNLIDRNQSRWRAAVEKAGIKSLPHYTEEDYPLALLLFWNTFDYFKVDSMTKVQEGITLLRSISEAHQRGLPHHLMVVGRDEDHFIALDRSRENSDRDCPVVSWPGEEDIADTFGDWLLTELARCGR